MGIRGFLTTLGLGIGAMYFMDSELGEQRRADVRNQVVKLRDEAQTVWSQGSEDLASRARDLRDKASRAPGDVMQAGKEALTGSPGGSKLQLDMSRPGDRLLTMTGGGLLALYGLGRGGLLGKLALLTGFNFVAKGLVQKDVLGDLVTKMRSTSDGAGIEFRKAIHVDAPVEQVFAFWQNYDNFPRFMAHLKEVRDMGDGRSHWIANGPAGTPIEWHAQVTEMRPNRAIAWESLPGSEVYNAGRVRFESVDGATRVDLFMTYNPPGGVAGHAIASLFGADPRSAMDDDLLKLKSLLEHGDAASSREFPRPSGAYQRKSRGGRSGAHGDDTTDSLFDGSSGGSAISGMNGGKNAPRETKPGS